MCWVILPEILHNFPNAFLDIIDRKWNAGLVSRDSGIWKNQQNIPVPLYTTKSWHTAVSVHITVAIVHAHKWGSISTGVSLYQQLANWRASCTPTLYKHTTTQQTPYIINTEAEARLIFDISYTHSSAYA